MADPVNGTPGRHLQPVTSHDVQAAAEGVLHGAAADTVLFKGQRFRIAEETGTMPLLMFANAAAEGLDSNDMAGLAAMYAMIRDCIADEAEWQRFVRHAVLTKASTAELMDVVNQTVAILTARPTGPPGDSSPGRPDTSDGSKGDSSLPATPPPPPQRVAPDLTGLVSVDDLVARSTP